MNPPRGWRFVPWIISTKLAEAKDAPRGLGSFSCLREKAGDEGGLSYADTLTPTLSRKRERELVARLEKSFKRRGWREAQWNHRNECLHHRLNPP